VRFLYIDDDQHVDGTVRLTAEQRHRIRKVLRLRTGDELVVRYRSTGAGWRTVVAADGRDAVVLQVTDGVDAVAAGPVVHLGVSLLKKRLVEWVVEKATELGVTSVTPLVAEHGVVPALSPNETRRLDAAAVEACQQCGRPLPPRINTALTPVEFVAARRAAGNTVVMLHQDEATPSLASADLRGPVALLVGPEGGFSTNELDACRAAGARCRFIPGWILRAETAAVAATALAAFLGRQQAEGPLSD